MRDQGILLPTKRLLAWQPPSPPKVLCGGSSLANEAEDGFYAIKSSRLTQNIPNGIKHEDRALLCLRSFVAASA